MKKWETFDNFKFVSAVNMIFSKKRVLDNINQRILDNQKAAVSFSLRKPYKNLMQKRPQN